MNLLPKGAKTFAAVMEKIIMYLMVILRRTKVSPWLPVKTAIAINGGGEDEEDEDDILLSVLEQRFEGQILIGIEPLGRVMAKFYRS